MIKVRTLQSCLANPKCRHYFNDSAKAKGFQRTEQTDNFLLLSAGEWPEVGRDNMHYSPCDCEAAELWNGIALLSLCVWANLG